MNRKWRHNPTSIDSVLSFSEFIEQIPPADAPYTLSTPADMYAIYTMLHIEKKEWELHWSTQGQFYFFIATEKRWKLPPMADDGDPLEALSDADDPQLQLILEEKIKAQAALKLQPPPLPPNQHPSSPDPEAEQQKEPIVRVQIIVPLSSASKQLTPRLLQHLFSIKGIYAQQLLLGLVDANGMVSRSCLYNYIQSPLEGPGTADLELLDD